MILRATIFHVPRNPFREEHALEAFADGGLVVDNGRLVTCGDYATVRAAHPHEPDRDLRGGILLPGLVDAHIHYPQVRLIGGIGDSLLDWLEKHTLPEEARFTNNDYAAAIADEFLDSLAAHGTTTALVFGAHFAEATAIFMEKARVSRLRIVSGLTVADRCLRPELHRPPERAYSESTDLIRRFHGVGRLLYAVTPRFALSASEAMLEVCRALMTENPGVRFQTHLNENVLEIETVATMFPESRDYLGVYEEFGLAGPRSVFAHSVHSTDSEIERLASHGCAAAFCPASNAALGSGFFPLERHVRAGVRVALGTDVGAGTGFGILKEGLQAYLTQRLAPAPRLLTSAELLYLGTRAGADALGLGDEIGDFGTGKAADFVYLRPPQRSPLAAVLRNAPSAERMLAAVLTLAGAESVRELGSAANASTRGQPMTLSEVNALDREAFVSAFGGIFEDSPWVARRAWDSRPFVSSPFVSRDDLRRAMTHQVESATREEQLALLRAHPDLGARARMSAESTREQAGAGLDQLTPTEFAELTALNRAYRDKFGFPFLFAVKGSGKREIMEALRRRVGADLGAEFAEALTQVYRIAWFRLEAAVHMEHSSEEA